MVKWGGIGLWLTVFVLWFASRWRWIVFQDQCTIALRSGTFACGGPDSGVTYYIPHGWTLIDPGDPLWGAMLYEWTWWAWRCDLGPNWCFIFPLWVPLVITLPFGIFALRRSRMRPGYCATCGYDLKGNVSGVCPECGTTPARKPESTG